VELSIRRTLDIGGRVCTPSDLSGIESGCYNRGMKTGTGLKKKGSGRGKTRKIRSETLHSEGKREGNQLWPQSRGYSCRSTDDNLWMQKKRTSEVYKRGLLSGKGVKK